MHRYNDFQVAYSTPITCTRSYKGALQKDKYKQYFGSFVNNVRRRILVHYTYATYRVSIESSHGTELALTFKYMQMKVKWKTHSPFTALL